MPKNPRKPNSFGSPPPYQRSATLTAYTWDAIKMLGDAGGFVPDTKTQFAFRMGWFTRNANPHVRRVEDICNMTRDLAYEQDETFCFNVIEYSPIVGGMHLTDPTKVIEPAHLFHALVGDMQRQQQAITQNRRRQPMWEQAGNAFANSGELDMAKLMWEANNEIKNQGWISGSTIGQVFRHARDRGLLS